MKLKTENKNLMLMFFISDGRDARNLPENKGEP